MWRLSDLLVAEGYKLQDVIVLRHCPPERRLNAVIPMLADQRPELFNAYQQTHGKKTEASLVSARFAASFIGLSAGRATFVGLYEIGKHEFIDQDTYRERQEIVELFGFGMDDRRDPRPVFRQFEMLETPFYSEWRGKLTIGWPAPEISWCRRAHLNEFPIVCISEESQFGRAMPDWQSIVLSGPELGLLPRSWEAALAHWRGIYYIIDTTDGLGYVGSAGGADNLLGRWRNYAKTGHGGNRLLRARNANNFQFSILQRVSPDMPSDEIVMLENSWKERLRSRAPYGLNDN